MSNTQKIIVKVGARTSPGTIKQVGIQFKDEGVNQGTAGTVNEIDFVGGSSLSRLGNKITVTIPNINSGTIPNESFNSTITFDQDATIDKVQSGNITVTFATSGNINAVTKCLVITGDSVNSLTITAPSGIPVRKWENSPNFDNTKINHVFFTYFSLVNGAPVIYYYINHSTQYSAEALAVFDLFTDSVPTALKDILATFIDGCVSNNLWTQSLDYFAMIRMNSSNNSLIDWKDQVVLVNSGSVYANSGWTFSGTAQYIKLGYIPSNSLLISQNNCGFGVYFPAASTGGSTAMGNLVSGLTWFLGRDPGNGLRIRIGNATDTLYTGETNFAAGGNYAAERTSSTAIALRKNGVVVQTGSLASGALPTNELYGGARNNAGSADSLFVGTIGAFYVFKPSTFNHSVFNTLLQNLMSSLTTYYS